MEIKQSAEKVYEDPFFLLILGLCFGVWFYFLVAGYLLWLGFLLFTTFFIAAFIGVSYGSGMKLDKVQWSILWALELLAVFLLLRVNQQLVAMDIITYLGLGGFLIYQSARASILQSKFREYLLTPFIALREILKGFVMTLQKTINSGIKSKNENVLRGIGGFLVALPLLIAFIGLFSSADPAFRHAVKNVFEFFFSFDLLPKILQITIYTLFGIGILASGTRIKTQKETEEEKPLEQKRVVETSVALGMFALLFAIFIGFQIRYLFGGQEVFSELDITYAQYAREWFSQLLAVTCIVSGILWAADWHLFDHRIKPNIRTYKVLASALIVLTLLILASAVFRIHMYQEVYGFTETRFYSYLAAWTIGITLLLLFGKIYVHIPEWTFLAYILITLFSSVVIANVTNPESFIAQKNSVTHSTSDRVSLDLEYIGSFSADAASSLAEIYKSVDTDGKEQLRWRLCNIISRSEARGKNWQEQNYSSMKALDILNPIRGELGCYSVNWLR